MKVAMVSTWDLAGGAARSAYRLHRGLVDIGVHSRILVQEKSSDDSTVIGQPRELAKIFAKARPLLEGISLRINRPVDNRTAFSTAWLPEKLVSRVAAQKPDIVHLHWVNYGFVRIETLARLPRPLVWTLHDMWAFTGGCHYDGGCGRYTDGCGQ